MDAQFPLALSHPELQLYTNPSMIDIVRFIQFTADAPYSSISIKNLDVENLVHLHITNILPKHFPRRLSPKATQKYCSRDIMGKFSRVSVPTKNKNKNMRQLIANLLLCQKLTAINIDNIYEIDYVQIFEAIQNLENILYFSLCRICISAHEIEALNHYLSSSRNLRGLSLSISRKGISVAIIALKNNPIEMLSIVHYFSNSDSESELNDFFTILSQKNIVSMSVHLHQYANYPDLNNKFLTLLTKWIQTTNYLTSLILGSFSNFDTTLMKSLLEAVNCSRVASFTMNMCGLYTHFNILQTFSDTFQHNQSVKHLRIISDSIMHPFPENFLDKILTVHVESLRLPQIPRINGLSLIPILRSKSTLKFLSIAFMSESVFEALCVSQSIIGFNTSSPISEWDFVLMLKTNRKLIFFSSSVCCRHNQDNNNPCANCEESEEYLSTLNEIQNQLTLNRNLAFKLKAKLTLRAAVIYAQHHEKIPDLVPDKVVELIMSAHKYGHTRCLMIPEFRY